MWLKVSVHYTLWERVVISNPNRDDNWSIGTIDAIIINNNWVFYSFKESDSWLWWDEQKFLTPFYEARTLS